MICPTSARAEAQQLVDDIVELLCRDFGYSRARGRPARKGNGARRKIAAERLAAAGRRHSCRQRAARQHPRPGRQDGARGMDGGAIVNFLRGLMNSSAAPRDQRWQERYDNLPRQVDSIQAKIEREQAAAAATAPTPAAGSGAPPPPPPPPPSPGTGPAPSAAPGPAPSSPIEDTLKTFGNGCCSTTIRRSRHARHRRRQHAARRCDLARNHRAAVERQDRDADHPGQHPAYRNGRNAELAGLLSGTPRRQQAAGAKGGLLQKIGASDSWC